MSVYVFKLREISKKKKIRKECVKKEHINTEKLKKKKSIKYDNVRERKHVSNVT